jgi:hypothetical protein
LNLARLPLDECMPRGLRRELPGHDMTTVQDMDCRCWLCCTAHGRSRH